MAEYRKKLIEVALPLNAINAASGREKSIRHGHPSTLHMWWARRPLAACRAVLFAQLVDDPSAWPELFPTEEAKATERERLFKVIRKMVPWEASTDEEVLAHARREIACSLARGREAEGVASERDAQVLLEGVSDGLISAYLAEVAPAVHDPFAGGGSIPLEAQRLGLRAIATDLNPVAVLINKALIEFPPMFSGRSPVGPESERKESRRMCSKAASVWPKASGLAEDVRRYGRWMREEAFKRIGYLYPPVVLPEGDASEGATAIAWIWARTVASPDPALAGVHVPLVSNFFLSTKKGRATWVEPVVEGPSYKFEVRTGSPKDPEAIKRGTKLGRGAHFRCILSGAPIEPEYVKAEACAGRMGTRLMAVVTEGKRRRVYVEPSTQQERAALEPTPSWRPDQSLPSNPRWFSPPDYGLPLFSDLFTDRQLVALNTFADLAVEARARIANDARAAGWADDKVGLAEGGSGARAYGEAVSTYLSLGVTRYANACTSVCTWNPGQKKEDIRFTFSRQALPMTWDFAEGNPFSSSSGNFEDNLCLWIRKAIGTLPAGPPSTAAQKGAQEAIGRTSPPSIFSLDPPYFDNIGYADLSDFFYVWQRRILKDIHPGLFRTLVTPKATELVATPYRHGGKAQAEAFFVEGMTEAMASIRGATDPNFPTTIYYAFKQSESKNGDTTSTGWVTFLEALTSAGLAVTGTWPVRTERGGRSISIGTNALASSVVLACRPLPEDAPSISRREFRRILGRELPEGIRALQHGNIAPVDMAQAAIGPGMAVLARYHQVLEADGSAMTIRSALALVNEVLDEHLSESEGELDAESRFAVTWFEAHRFEAGPYGDAENLARAKNVAVSGVQAAGLAQSAAGKVRLLTRDELPEDWDPASDTRSTVWEATQHLIKRLESGGEQPAADLLRALGERGEEAKELAYRLYVGCERQKWAEEARAYNGLVQAWPELVRLAAQGTGGPRAGSQQEASDEA